MTQQRDQRGRFVKGNKIRQKPLKCPYCEKELWIRNYTYVKKKEKNNRNKTGETYVEKS